MADPATFIPEAGPAITPPSFIPEESPSVATLMDTESQRRGIDRRFLSALLAAEGGGPGKEFGVLSVPTKSAADRTRVAANTIANNAERFEVAGGSAIGPDGKYTPEFIKFFSDIYAPIGAENDPTGLNKNHYPNLMAKYGQTETAQVPPSFIPDAPAEAPTPKPAEYISAPPSAFKSLMARAGIPAGAPLSAWGWPQYLAAALSPIGVPIAALGTGVDVAAKAAGIKPPPGYGLHKGPYGLSLGEQAEIVTPFIPLSKVAPFLRGVPPAERAKLRLTSEGFLTGRPAEESAAAAGPTIFQPKTVNAEQGAYVPGIVDRIFTKTKELLPQDYAVWREHPTSPVVTLADKALDHDMAQVLKELGKKPVWHKIDKMEDWVAIEQKAYNVADVTQDFQRGVAALPKEAREIAEYLHFKLRPMEKRAIEYFRESVFPEKEAIRIWPHVTEEAAKDVIKLEKRFQGMARDIRTGLGMFEKESPYATMAEGIANGAKYIDPRAAMWMRIWAGQKLVATHSFIEGLEKAGVIYKKAESALAATGKAIPVKGIPGGEWFARSVSEARFIRDHLTDPHRLGSLAKVTAIGNAVFRNINLWNPLPHYTKNMLYKYGLNSGNFTRLVPQTADYLKQAFPNSRVIQSLTAPFKTDPAMKALFDAYMPFDPRGKGAHQLFIEGLRGISGETLTQKMWRLANMPNQFSARTIFGAMDPSIKYARFKQYVTAGLHPQEAANQVNLDLIRYSRRSEALDMWRSMPFNFFAQWRLGTVVSLAKAIRHKPLQAMLFIGFIDSIREIMYRETGWWIHTPIDYIEAPIVRVLEGFAGSAREGAEVSAALTATTALFGPGGEYTGTFWGQLIKLATTGRIDMKALERAFWGLSLFLSPYGAKSEWDAYQKDQNPRHFVNIGMMFAAAAHDAVNYRPRRFGQIIPEAAWTRSQRVRSAESIQESRDLARRLHEQYSPGRTTIRQIVGE